MRDGLKHIMYELNQQRPNLFRIGKEAYNFLYRSMTEALLGGNPDNVTYEASTKRDKHRTHIYQLGSSPWQKIKKQKIKGCKTLWRYSQPVQYIEPTFKDNDIRKEPSIKNSSLLMICWQ